MNTTTEKFPGLGERLKKYRLAAGLSADKLVEKVHNRFPDTGVSRQIVFNIEKGRREIRLDELCEISMALDIEPTALICDFSKPFDTITYGPFKDCLPEDVTSFFYTFTSESDLELLDTDNPTCSDNCILIYGTTLTYMLSGFEAPYKRSEFILCPTAIEGARSCIKELRNLNAEIPPELIERFNRDLELMKQIAENDPKISEQWNTVKAIMQGNFTQETSK